MDRWMVTALGQRCAWKTREEGCVSCRGVAVGVGRLWVRIRVGRPMKRVSWWASPVKNLIEGKT